MIEISFNREGRVAPRFYIQVRDGKRGVIRLTEEDATELADAISFLRSDRSRK